MRRALLTDVIEELWSLDYTTKVAVEQMATGDVNVPGYDTAHPVATGVPMGIQQMGAKERQQRSALYTTPPTHTAYCDAAEYLRVGYRLRETHELSDGGRWAAITDATQQALYEIIGIDRLPRTALAGITPPEQRVLILSQTSPMN